MVVAQVAGELGHALTYAQCELVAAEIGKEEVTSEAVSRAMRTLSSASFAFAAA